MTALLEQSPLPTRHAVRTLIEDLINRPVDLRDGAPVPVKPTNVVAAYVTDKLTVSALAVANLECAAWLGGSLGMLPKGGIEDAIKEGTLPDMVGECCYEVLNVLASVFNVPNAPHVRLYQMYGPGEKVPSDLGALAALVGSRLDVKLSIGGYGDGLFSIVVR